MNSQMKRYPEGVHRSVWLHGVEVHDPPRTQMCSLIWKLSEPHHLGCFMKVSLCSHDWLNHWQLTISSISILVPFLVVERWNWKFQFFNHGLVFLVTSFHPKPHLRGLPKVTPLLGTKGIPSTFNTLGNSKGLGSFVQGTEGKDQISLY